MLEEKKEDLTVAGYVFANHSDAETARNEIKKIAYIETKMDMTNMSIVLGIYNKALDNRTFQTPVGLEFMHRMEEMLKDSGMDPAEIRPIPLYTTFRRIDFGETKPEKRRLTRREEEEKKLRVKYRNSVLITTILTILIVMLLIISFNGPSMNAINYKAAVTNQYAEWDQELTDREAVIREKERELGITSEPVFTE